MNRNLTSLISLGILSGATLSIANAQENFPDVPTNHWAYAALFRLKLDGILVGYPDGIFRGSRPVSRYEMAAAFHSAYVQIQQRVDGLQNQIDTLKASDVPKLRDMIAILKDQIDSLKKLGPELDDLKRASETFELQLEQLGVDVEAMKKTLGSLHDRVSKLEDKKPPIDIHGDLDFWYGAGTSRNHEYGLNKDGRLVGTGTPAGVTNLFPPVDSPVGFEHNNSILHEAGFTISGTNDKGPHWSATIVESDMFGNFGASTPTVAFGNQSDVFNSADGINSLTGYSPGQEDLYLQEGSIQFGGPHAYLEIGRIGYSLSPYLYRRIDNTSYYSNPRWDNGKYYFDGVRFGGSLGPAKLTLFGGLNSEVESLQGVQLNPVRSGPIGGIFSPPVFQNSSGVTEGLNTPTGIMTFDRNLGANLQLGIGRQANLDLGWVLLEGDSTNVYGQTDNFPLDVSTNANRLSVYGADADWKLGGFKIEGGAHKSDIQEDSQTVVGTQNGAWNAKISFDRPIFGVSAEYRQIEPNFVAPGDWGRLGVLRNPSNIKGLEVGGHLKLFRKLELKATGTFDSGLLNDFGNTTFLGTGTTIRGYDFRIGYDINSRFGIFADLENTHFGDLAVPSTYSGTNFSNYKWLTFGMNYKVSQNALYNLAYEESDVDNDYQLSGGASFHGGFITSQISYRF